MANRIEVPGTFVFEAGSVVFYDNGGVASDFGAILATPAGRQIFTMLVASGVSELIPKDNAQPQQPQHAQPQNIQPVAQDNKLEETEVMLGGIDQFWHEQLEGIQAIAAKKLMEAQNG